MSTVTVQIEALKADLTPYGGREVIVTLVAGSAGASYGETGVVVESTTVRLDPDGTKTIDLTPNDELSPDGTFYRFTVRDSSPTIERTVVLTAETSDPVSWSDESIQVASPVPPGYAAGIVNPNDFAKLNESNIWTAYPQTMSGEVPLIPIGDVGTTEMPLLLAHTDDNGDELFAAFSVSLDLGGGNHTHSTGVRWPEFDGADRTGAFFILASGPVGLQLLKVPGSTIADLFSPEPVAWSVAEATDDGHAMQKVQVETLVDEVAGALDTLSGVVDAKADQAYTGAGLFFGIEDLPTAVTAAEGVADRWAFVPAAWEGADARALDLATLTTSGGTPTATYGPGLSGGPTTRVFVVGRTDPAEDGQYLVPGAGPWQKINHPNVFDPPGNGYRVTVKPVDGVHGPITWMATMDSESFYMRGGNFGDEADLDGEPFTWRRLADSTARPGGMHSSDGETVAWVRSEGSTRVTDNGTFTLPILEEYDHGLEHLFIVESTGAEIASLFTAAGEHTPYALTDESAVWVKFYGYGDGYWFLVDDTSTGGAGGGPDLSDASPAALGSVSAGTSPDASRADHVHPTTGLALSSHDHSGVYQPADADLTALAALTTTSYGRALLELANAAALRTAGGLVIGTDVQAYDADLAAIAALTSPATKIPTAVILSADRGTTSTSLADTTGLSFSVTSGVSYCFRAVLFVTGDTAGDLKVAFTHPGGTLNVGQIGINNGASALPANMQTGAVVTSSGTAVGDLGTFTGSTVMHVFEGTFIASSSGTFQVQHACRGATGTTTVKAGSVLTYFTA